MVILVGILLLSSLARILGGGRLGSSPSTAEFVGVMSSNLIVSIVIG